MAFRFIMLASGSSGNAALIQADGFGLLIDAGLGPRQMAARLAAVGANWQSVQAVLLTHTHGDHWKDRTLGFLAQQKIPFYCHPAHHQLLQTYSPGFSHLLGGDLVRCYEPGREIHLSPRLRCRPLAVRHDSGPTFGFRVDGFDGPAAPSWAVGYVADLGCWSPELADALANVDVLAVEFNYDDHMERYSRRPAELIERVLGDDGHLSNVQAADLVRAVLERSEPGAVRHLVQLHLSRECNRPALARTAARLALGEERDAIAVHTAAQDHIGPLLTLEPGLKPKPRTVRSVRVTAQLVQQCLPGMG